MDTVTVSPKYQIVIPRAIREALALKPGQKIQALQFDGRIELIPVQPMSKSRGFLKGIARDIKREPDRE